MTYRTKHFKDVNHDNLAISIEHYLNSLLYNSEVVSISESATASGTNSYLLAFYATVVTRTTA